MASLDSWKQGTEENINEIHDCYCPNCSGGKAHTILLPTSIPMFREIYIMTLTCPDCNFKNSQVNFGGEIQRKGVKITLSLASPWDLNRQLVKSDSATLGIPALSFEIPPGTQRGTVSTIEGMMMTAARNLEALQSERLRLGDMNNFYRCRTVIRQMKRLAGHPDEDDEEDIDEDEDADADADGMVKVHYPFDIILNDPAGNSFIENPHAPAKDVNTKEEYYIRTPTQDLSLGLQPSKEALESGEIEIDDENPTHENAVHEKDMHSITIDEPKAIGRLGRDEAIKFPTDCPSCYKHAETAMCVTDIPHFKEIIIMSLHCEKCGFRSNEIKASGAIPMLGTKIILKVGTSDDLSREVLKSDTAGIEVPELELELNEGGLDGFYTTVEGLLGKIHDRLTRANPFGTGDSATMQHTTNDGGEFSKPSPSSMRYMEFLDKLESMKEGNSFPFTLVISDPLSNSFIGPLPGVALQLAKQAAKEGSNECHAHYVDPGMEIEEYERTFDQNESLGLNDMQTENYNNHDKKYHGTDKPAELPDRLRKMYIRGLDHPHAVAKGSEDGDNTAMGQCGAHFAIPVLAQIGKLKANGASTS